MNTVTRLVELELAKRGLYRLPDATQQVTVRAGTVWITQDNDTRDFILEAGQSFVPDGQHQAVLLYALNPARFTISTAASPREPAWRAPCGLATRDLVLE